MTAPDKTELKASLADNAMQLQEAVSHLSNRVNNEDWHEALDAIAKIRAVQADLEAKLKALAEQSENAGAPDE
jgi:hypothetical protein